MRIFFSMLLVICTAGLCAQTAQPAGLDTTRRRMAPPPIGTITPTRETPAHDPVMIKQNGKFYLFTTGNGVAVFSSTDMEHWRKEKSVFDKAPGWVSKALPVVGRSEKAAGPYLDKNGTDLAKNGGTLIVQGDNKEWFGAGHNSAYTFDGKDYIIYHGYDAKDRGRSKLIIKELKWEDGWPVPVQ